MKEKIKQLFRKEKKKKTYTATGSSPTTTAYWILVLSLGGYFLFRVLSNKQVAAPMLFLLPALLGIIFILFMLPVWFLNFFITEIVLRVRLFHVPRGIPTETVVVIGKSEYLSPSYWTAPNYSTDLLLAVEYLRFVGKPFSIYYEASTETVDEIMANRDIKTVFFFGHGRRHSFGIDKSTAIDYCRYDDPKYAKDYVYQIHCNHGKGKSLVEYVVPSQNQSQCLPEHGYMSALTVGEMFVDKIIALKQQTGYKTGITKLKYKAITMIIPSAVLIGWTYIFLWMVS